METIRDGQFQSAEAQLRIFLFQLAPSIIKFQLALTCQLDKQISASWSRLGLLGIRMVVQAQQPWK